MSGALHGVRVLDVSQVLAGAYCSALLADMGAEVVKVERPGRGDDTRAWQEAFPGGESPAFMAANRNKRGIAIDLGDERGAGVVRRLAAGVDVLVENFRPGTMARHGLDWPRLRELNPALVYCSISGFGQTGPYAERGGYDLIAQGMSGIMSVTGEPGRPPAKAGVPVCDLTAGMFAAYGVLSAYVHRLRTGEGQLVDAALLDAGVALTVWETAMFTGAGVVAGPAGSAHQLAAPYEALRTADGWITVGAANQRNWEQLCKVLSAERLSTDERFATPSDRLANRAELAELLEQALATHPSAWWLEGLASAGVPAGPIYDIAQVHDDPQVLAREMLVEVRHPTAGTVRHLGVPVKLSGTPGGLRRPAPRLGEHTREVLAEHGLPSAEIDELMTAGVTAEARESRRG